MEKLRSKKATERDGGRKGVLYFTASTVIFVLLLGYYYQDLLLSKQNSSQLAYTVQNVSRQKLCNGSSYRELVELRIPLVITDSVIHKWRARTLFTPSFLAEKLPLVSVYTQEKRTFATFHDNKPLEPLVNELWEDFNIKTTLSIPDILGWNNPHISPHVGPFHYYSQDVAQLREMFPEILTHLQPIEELILSEENAQVNLWVGRKGIITHTHYDATYNFFMQLQGRKRFTLFPPNQTLYLYPCLHPHYGHSQVDILLPDLAHYPLFKNSKAIVAEIGPGDMLIIPPYWFHHVETLQESVSINVWSDAPEYAIMNEIYTKPIPFESEWEHEELAKASRVYIEMLLESMEIQNSTLFVRDLVLQRYEPLVRKGNIMVNNVLLNDMERLFLTVDWNYERKYYRPVFKRSLPIKASLFKQIPVKATMLVCLGNYVEHLLHRTVGIDDVYPFLIGMAGLSCT